MSCCMQPDGRNAHICGSKAAGVKTPKHPLHRCLDFSVMRYGDGRSWRESRDAPSRPVGALLRDDCGMNSFLYLLCRATCWCLPSNTQKKEREARRWDGIHPQTQQQLPRFPARTKTFLLSAVFLSGLVVFLCSKTKSLDCKDKFGCALHLPSLSSQRTRV